jgi:hypothetical protein
MKPGFFKGQSGQTSIEIAFVTGAIFLIVISALPYITDANMMNKGVTAARDGATFSQTMLNMGYSTGDISLPRGERVHVDDISYTEETSGSIKIVRIKLTISGTNDNDVATEITSQAGNYIHYAFNAQWNTSTGGTVNVGDYRFIVSHVFA